MKVCTFFGHRDAYLQDLSPLQEAIREAIVLHGCTSFWCGGYGAFDSAAAQAVRSLKPLFPSVELVLVYAYLPAGQDPRAAFYDATLFPDGLETTPPRFAISRRNEWLARRCDMAIVKIDRTYGGAYQAFRIISRRGIPCIRL